MAVNEKLRYNALVYPRCTSALGLDYPGHLSERRDRQKCDPKFDDKNRKDIQLPTA